MLNTETLSPGLWEHTVETVVAKSALPWCPKILLFE